VKFTKNLNNMSRLGKLPILLPAGTQAKFENDFLIVKGAKGELNLKIHKIIKIDINEKEILVSVKDEKNKEAKPLWGLFRTLINNMVIGVNKGYEKKLEIIGVGFRSAVSGKKLTLSLGFSHPVEFILPEKVNCKVEANIITLSSIDKQLLGEIAAQIRKIKKPEPYKGKGIKYTDEIIRRKEGKTAAKGAK